MYGGLPFPFHFHDPMLLASEETPSPSSSAQGTQGRGAAERGHGAGTSLFLRQPFGSLCAGEAGEGQGFAEPRDENDAVEPVGGAIGDPLFTNGDEVRR